MQTKGKKSLKNIYWAEVMTGLIADNDGKAATARKLGITPGTKEFKAMEVKLGNYEAGRARPKADFIELWKEMIGDDLPALVKERKVSHGTKKEQNVTSVPEPAIKKKDPNDEVRILIKNLDRMGELNEYLLRELKNYQDRFGRI